VIIDLNIASLIIRLQSEDDILLTPGERFAAFVSTGAEEPDVVLKVYASKAYVPMGVEKVFTAPLVEETAEGLKNSEEPFWYVSKGIDTLYVQARVTDPKSWPLLIIPENKNIWHIFLGLNRPETDPAPFAANPLPYPLDGLLFYYLVSKKGGLMIHGSGVIADGRGWLFTGKSGQGKTTMARIFDGCGDRVIHDDRLILRKDAGGWVMYSTPVYRNDEPRSARLDHLWLISHGQSNISTPVSGAEAAGLILANCIQQNWDGKATERLAVSVEELVSSVAVSRLQFAPDRSVREYLLIRAGQGMADSAAAARELLREEREIVITAGGYSMWPALIPGDRLIISPLKTDAGPGDNNPGNASAIGRSAGNTGLAGSATGEIATGNFRAGLAVGDVVAMSRDGGFVAHRITELKGTESGLQIRTRGDSSRHPDPWLSENDIAGVIRLVRRGSTEISVAPRRLPFTVNRMFVALLKIRDRFSHPGGGGLQ
jgi:hypothetical protein